MTDLPVYSGELFRLEHLAIEGRQNPYEFVRRIGAVTILPVLLDSDDKPTVLAIHNLRTYYGASFGLPGGNAEGGFESPESPYETAARELREEIGFAPRNPETDLEVFKLRDISSTISYPRYFAVARNLQYVGGESNDPDEQITLSPLPLYDYLRSAIGSSRGELYPEVTLALSQAANRCGEVAVMIWLAYGQDLMTDRVRASFDPWMEPIADSRP